MYINNKKDFLAQNIMNNTHISLYEANKFLSYYYMLNTVVQPFHKSKYPFDTYKTGKEITLLAKKCMLKGGSEQQTMFADSDQENPSNQESSPAFVVGTQEGDIVVNAGKFLTLTL